MPTQEATISLLRSGHIVYDVWLMTGLKDNRRIAECTTLHEAHKMVTPAHRKEYVYILKWTQSSTPTTTTTTTTPFGPNGPFGTLQGQHRAPVPVPTCHYIWGCLCNRVHTNDLRESVRHILRE